MTISGNRLRGASGNTALRIIPQTAPKRRNGDAETASRGHRRNGIPYGIRTRVTRMRTWCPGPLDERDSLFHPNGIPYGIRTRVTRMRTWCPRPLDERDLFSSNGIPKGIRTPVTRMKTWCPRPLDDGNTKLTGFIIYLTNRICQVKNERISG